MKSKIRLSKSCLDNKEARVVTDVIRKNGYLGMGNEVYLFEKEIANYLNVPESYVVCVNSGTAALHLAIQAISNPRDEVLVQSLTYLSSFQAISASNAIPIACEVNENTAGISLLDAKKKLSKFTKVIMPVHYASNPDGIIDVYKFAKKNKLRVIEDAAHAFGCKYRGKKIGSFGDIICFSFDGIKNITSGEGGCVVTSDKKVAQYVRDARLLGIKKDTEKRFAGKRSWDFDVFHQGYRYHMSNLFAAIGRVQLKKLDSIFSPKRKKIAKIYRETLSGINDLLFFETNLDEYIPHIQPIRIINGKRDLVRKILDKNNIETGIHYKPNHLLSIYYNKKNRLPLTEKIYSQIVTLPLHPELKYNDIIKITNLIKKTLQKKN
jgi:dTDP-4-amino-4,6-dideoxygalactose transaminase|tara:strand:+ start:14740 stop:15876 length:1137 start_codon:yes stop_codon:yes gene_type:complete